MIWQPFYDVLNCQVNTNFTGSGLFSPSTDCIESRAVSSYDSKAMAISAVRERHIQGRHMQHMLRKFWACGTTENMQEQLR